MTEQPATPTSEDLIDWNRATAVAAARQAIMWAGVPAQEAERYAMLAVENIAQAGLLLPTGTTTVEQHGYRITRDGQLVAEEATPLEAARVIVRNQAAGRETDPRWQGDATLVRRFQHTTPFEPVDDRACPSCARPGVVQPDLAVTPHDVFGLASPCDAPPSLIPTGMENTP